MKIVGDSIQEGIPTPENPKEIKHEPKKIVIHTINGEEIMIPITKELKEGDFIFKSQKDGKWYIRRRKQMDEEEKKAIELLDLFEPSDLVECAMYRNALSIIKNLIDKQNKVIDEMIKWIDDRCFYSDDCGNHCEIIEDSCYDITKNWNCKECIKQYFIRKVKDETTN